jgi:chemotaxis protein CheX
MINLNDEEKLLVFVKGTTNFFKEITRKPASVGTPYLMDTMQPLAYDYTGIIGISGERKGSIYFTAPANFLMRVLVSMGETDLSRDSLMDIVGEVANTISGNARNVFGERFMISVPTVVSTRDDHIRLPKNTRSYIIPIEWSKHQAALVITLSS